MRTLTNHRMQSFSKASRTLNIWLTVATVATFVYLLAVMVEFLTALSHYNFLGFCLPGCGASYSLRVSSIISDWQSWVLLSDYMRPLYVIIWMLVLANASQPNWFLVGTVTSAIFLVVEGAKFAVHTFAYFNFSSFWYATKPSTSTTVKSTEFYLIYWTTVGSAAYLIFTIVLSLILRNNVENERGKEQIEEAVDAEPDIAARMIGGRMVRRMGSRVRTPDGVYVTDGTFQRWKDSV